MHLYLCVLCGRELEFGRLWIYSEDDQKLYLITFSGVLYCLGWNYFSKANSIARLQLVVHWEENKKGLHTLTLMSTDFMLAFGW